MKMNWEPRDSDLAWCSMMVGILKHHGLWATKDPVLCYKHDKINKQLVLVLGNKNCDVHEQNKIAFGKIGYKVTEL